MSQEEHIVKVLEVKEKTHNVLAFRVEKPEGYEFKEGQATELSINKPDLKDKKRPFTFTSLNESEDLEFTIKTYDDHENGMTKHLREVKEGDEFIIRDVWGAIEFKGQGIFIAGGAGVTPFIAILRKLRKLNKLKGNMLIFSNKKEEDIINKDEFDSMSSEGLEVMHTLTEENNVSGCENRRIDLNYLKEKIPSEDFGTKKFYVCGPIRMVGELQDALQKLGADSESIVLES